VPAVKPASSYTHCTIAVRLPGGEQRQREFEVTATVADVTRWAAGEAGSNVSLMTTFPRQIYNTPTLLATKLADVQGMVPRGLFTATRA